MISFMRLLFIKFFFLYCLQGYSQAGYSILYSGDSDISLTINGVITKRPLSYGRLVFNDSVSFYYGFGATKKDPMKKNKNYGSKVFNHAEMSFKNSDIHYVGVAYPPGSKHFFVIDTTRKYDWVITEEVKTILGFNCKKAFWINEYLLPSDSTSTWHSDSTIAWYTNKINLPYGQADFRGLPGVILEAVYPSLYGKSYLYAIKIMEDNFTIGVPQNISIITYAEFKGLKRHMPGFKD